jgi:hypothetical protein
MFRALKVGGGSAVALVLVLTAVTQSAKVGAAAAAPAERRLDCGGGELYDAVMVIKATVHDSEVPCHASRDSTGRFQPPAVFQANDDWLANTDIYLFNRTSKQIVYGDFIVSFPEAPTRNVVPISLGIMPAVAAFDHYGRPMPQNGRQPWSVGPGQTFVIHLANYIDDITNALTPVLPAALTKVSINAQSCMFDDGMMWQPGANYLVPDQTHPGQWTHMPRGYHPDGYGKGRH